jgi:hypothetical protein
MALLIAMRVPCRSLPDAALRQKPLFQNKPLLNQRLTGISLSTTSIFQPRRCFTDVLHLKHLKHLNET